MSPDEWTEARLMDVVRPDAPIGYGIVQPGPYVRGGIPVLAIRDLARPSIRTVHRTSPSIEAQYRRSRVVSGDILISVKGTTGRIGLVPEGFRGNISRDVARLRLSDKHEPRYWLQLLQSPSAQQTLQLAAVGTTRQELSIGTLKTLAFPFPERREQRLIAALLSDADRLINALEALMVKKQAIKQGIAQQLLSGRVRLPQFGEPWTWQAFGEVMGRINPKSSQVLASTYRNVGLVPVIDQGQTRIIGYTDDLDAAFDPGPGGVIVFGDHTCITKFVDFRFAVGADGTQLVRAKSPHSTRFFAYALEADPVISTGYNRHFKFLRERVLPVPPRDEQDAIVAVLADADAETDLLKQRLVKAKAIKEGMAQQLLTGRVRLLELEAVA
jgi:type I restriction enzyme S subunit